VQKLANYHLRSRVFLEDFAARLPHLPQLTVYEPNSSNPQAIKKHQKRHFSNQIAL
jgi:hypothetical protein